MERKLEIQSEYIKKIESELYNEVISKKRLLIYVRNSERNYEQYREKSELLEGKLSFKETTIHELRETIKNLENQLCLMDDKCMQLRVKINEIYKKNSKKEKKMKEQIFQQSQNGRHSAEFPQLHSNGTSSSNMSKNNNYNYDSLSLESGGGSSSDVGLDDGFLTSEDFANFTSIRKSSQRHSNKTLKPVVGPTPEMMLENIENKLRKKTNGGMKTDWTREKLNALLLDGDKT